ncbi:MAG: hypothetical protein KF841_00910 [Phycisphaerae bacterium]|nr:hypothetical protein [Phycisphaerae bacterium]
MNESDRKLLMEIDESEAWLSRFEVPLSFSHRLEEVKRAVRSELAAADASRRLESAWLNRLRPWHGSMAAAAVLAICVGVAYFSSAFSPSTDDAILLADRDAAIEAEMGALVKVLSASGDRLSDLEELAGTDAWAIDDVSFYRAFEEAFGDWPESDGATDRTGAMLDSTARSKRSGEIS